MLDDDTCYRALAGRDRRFDGVFVTGVLTTGIYCRPSCPARTPRPEHVRFFPTAAAAARGGLRACKRCRPDAAPGSPEWDSRADVVARAVRLIGDGVVDRDGVAGLARSVGYSERQLHRLLVAELGAGAQALARAQRAQTARILLETTTLPAADVAFAAGFASVRQFNETVRAVFATAPTDLRRAGPPVPGSAEIALRLPFRAPLHRTGLLAFLAARAVVGCEEVVGTTYRRTLALPHGWGIVELDLGGDELYVPTRLRLAQLRDLPAAVARCRRLLDLDADPVAVDATLAADPLLAPAVAARPGLRSPGAVDGFELAVRALLGQQVSVAAARRLGARLVAEHGAPLPSPSGSLVATFPSADVLAAADPATLPLPATRAHALVGLAAAVADGRLRLDAGADRRETSRSLLELPGVGPWTAQYVAMRALGDPDAWPAADLGVRRGLTALDVGTERARAWRPWRSYAVHHLWALAAEREEMPSAVA